MRPKRGAEIIPLERPAYGPLITRSYLSAPMIALYMRFLHSESTHFPVLFRSFSGSFVFSVAVFYAGSSLPVLPLYA